MREAVERLITPYRVRDPIDSQHQIGLLLQLAGALEDGRDEPCSVYQMSKGMRRERGVTDKGKHSTNLFQGEQPTKPKALIGSIYPGDRNIRAEDTVSIQIHLRTAQPALSRHISDLEAELGLKLFDRVGRRLRLTGEGEQLLGHCRGLLNYASAIGEQAQLLRRGDTGVLKVAASSENLEGAIAPFLHRYAQRYPNVKVKLFDVIGPELLAMLERGDLHVAQSSIHALQSDDHRFGHLPLAPVEILAACHPSLKLGEGPTIDIGRLAPHPLILQDPAFVVRRVFDAACRLAGLKPDILLESRAPHTLVAMAEAGHGVAIIPSALRTRHYKVRIFGVTYRGKALREQLIILWDKRRPLPRYATSFCEMLADHFRAVFPISRPSVAEQGDAVRRRGSRR